jgi:hypothetical protein
MKTELKAKEIAGGSPSAAGRTGKSKHADDSVKSSKAVMKDATAKSENENMTGKKGYNETPSTVPVKAAKQK